MKKIIVIIASVTFIANISNAQKNRSGVRESPFFGLKAGANYSNVYDTKGETFNADAKLGLAAGAFVAIPIGIYLGIQPEILFSQKGFQATGSILGIPYGLTRTSSYIDIPILFSLKPNSLLTFQAGPQYSYLVKQRDEFVNVTTIEEEFKNENIRKNILCFLGGVDINLDHLVLGGRVGWDILNNNGDGTSSTPRYKNVWYQVTIGFRFYN